MQKISVSESVSLTPKSGATPIKLQAHLIQYVKTNGTGADVFYKADQNLAMQKLTVTQSRATIASAAAQLIQVTDSNGAFHVNVDTIEDYFTDGGAGSYISFKSEIFATGPYLLQVLESPSALQTAINAATPLGNFVTTDTNQSITGQKTFTQTVIADSLQPSFGHVMNLNDGTGSTQASVYNYGFLFYNALENKANNGLVGSPAVQVREYGDGHNHVTMLVLTNLDLGLVPAAANLALGQTIYTLPGGVQTYEVTSMQISVQGDAAVQADTPEIGVGCVPAFGAVATLGGTANFEKYVVGTTISDCNGTFDNIDAFPTAGSSELLGVLSAKEVCLNIAGAWSGATNNLFANGSIIIKWTTLI